MTTHAFDGQLWEWTGQGAKWVFVTLPEALADEVEAHQVGPERGFGAVKVRVTLGSSTWKTSMFPSKEHSSYILPIKAAVRQAASVDVGDTAHFEIELIAP